MGLGSSNKIPVDIVNVKPTLIALSEGKDGQEAKELPQGGSLRDNVDTSVTLKRTFLKLFFDS